MIPRLEARQPRDHAAPHLETRCQVLGLELQFRQRGQRRLKSQPAAFSSAGLSAAAYSLSRRLRRSISSRAVASALAAAAAWACCSAASISAHNDLTASLLGRPNWPSIAGRNASRALAYSRSPSNCRARCSAS